MAKARDLCEPLPPDFYVEPNLEQVRRLLLEYMTTLKFPGVRKGRVGAVEIDLDTRHNMIRIRKPYTDEGDYARIKLIDDEK